MNLLDDVPGNNGSILLVRDLFQDDDELISPEASQHIGVPESGVEPSGNRLQKFVAGLMSERIARQSR